MISDIHNSQGEHIFSETNGVKVPISELNAKKDNSANQEAQSSYNLSLSDENWEILGGGDAEKEEDKANENNKKENKAKNNELTDEEQRKVDELKKIDKNVRTHEQAHLNASGGYARGVAYDYVTGPDGKRYASSGHVNLDTSREKTPEATIRKANIIRKAALAPADPSPADRQIAADAAKMASDAQREINEQNRENSSQHKQSNSTPPATNTGNKISTTAR